jgi:hypothetical protein
MSKFKSALLGLCLVGAHLCAPNTSLAQDRVNPTITYQGQLNSNGQEISGIRELTFTLYSDAEGKQKVWSAKYPVTFDKGIFSVELGSGHYPLPAASMTDKALWLGLQVENSDEMRPLTKLGASILAMNVVDNSITASKLETDYIASIAVNGRQISGEATKLNFVGMDGIDVRYDGSTESIVIRHGTNGHGGKGGEVQVDPLLELGDMIYGDDDGHQTRLVANYSSTKKFLTETGTGTVGGVPTWSTIAASDLPSLPDISGTLDVASGGTGATSLTANGVLIGNGTSAITGKTLTNGQVLIGSTSNAPVAATITGTTNQVNVTNGSGSIILSTPQDIATSSSPTFNNLALSGKATSAATVAGDASNTLTTKGYVDAKLVGTSGWELTGNAGTDPNANFIGTTDNTDLILRANDAERLIIYAEGPTRILGSMAIGNSGSTGVSSVAAGESSSSTGYASTAFGNNASSSGYASTALGGSSYWSNPDGSAPPDQGYYEGPIASGPTSLAMGSGTISSGYGAFAGGLGTSATGDISFSYGWGNIASGQVASAIGGWNSSTGYITTAIGFQNLAEGYYSLATGGGTFAIGPHSFSGGAHTYAIGPASVALGSLGKAEGYASFVMGGGTSHYYEPIGSYGPGPIYSGPYAQGEFSAALGIGTRAYGTASISTGLRTAAGDYSFSAGRGMKIGNNSFGFSAHSNEDSVDVSSMDNAAYFGNVNMMIGNDDNTARELRFYEPNTSNNYNGTNYTAFKGQTQSANITYTLPSTQGSANSVLSNDGTGNLTWAAAAPAGWTLTGNSGTTAGTNYIGTSDNQPVDFRTNSITRLRINTNGSIQRDATGDARGLNAVDLQVARGFTTQVASGEKAVVAGGQSNTASSPYSTVSGGINNSATHNYATVSGGITNRATGQYSNIAGGYTNTASGEHSAIAGGGSNVASGRLSFVGGGGPNTASGNNAFVGAGSNNRSAHNGSFIGAGANNFVESGASVIVGGENNYTHGTGMGYSSVVGGHHNSAGGIASIIGGGQYNGTGGQYSSIVGGDSNYTVDNHGAYSFIGGGRKNQNWGRSGMIGAGELNTAFDYGAVAGGFKNSAGDYSGIPGGRNLRLGRRSFGFNADTSGNMTNIAATTWGEPDHHDLAYFGNTDLWIGNVDNSARSLKFFEPNSSYNYGSTNYTAFKAQAQSANITYTLPAAQGASGSVMLNDGSGSLSWSTSIPQSSVQNLASDLSAKAADNVVVHLTGNESVGGVKTFTAGLVAAGVEMSSGSLILSHSTVNDGGTMSATAVVMINSTSDATQPTATLPSSGTNGQILIVTTDDPDGAIVDDGTNTTSFSTSASLRYVYSGGAWKTM